MRKALLVAFQFPPFKASSGLERTLSLVRHLPEFGWEPMVELDFEIHAVTSTYVNPITGMFKCRMAPALSNGVFD